MMIFRVLYKCSALWNLYHSCVQKTKKGLQLTGLGDQIVFWKKNSIAHISRSAYLFYPQNQISIWNEIGSGLDQVRFHIKGNPKILVSLPKLFMDTKFYIIHLLKSFSGFTVRHTVSHTVSQTDRKTELKTEMKI